MIWRAQVWSESVEQLRFVTRLTLSVPVLDRVKLELDSLPQNDFTPRKRCASMIWRAQVWSGSIELLKFVTRLTLSVHVLDRVISELESLPQNDFTLANAARR